MNDQILISLIKGISTILATAIPSMVAFWSAKRLINKEKFKSDLLNAYKDIVYMNELEKQFIKNNKELFDESMKNTMHTRTRDVVGYYKSEKGKDSYVKKYIEMNNA